MDIKPIVTDQDYQDALKQIERLWGADPASEDGTRLDALATLVAAYEEKQWSGGEADPVDTIRAHMEWNGYTQSDLAKVLGSRSRASEILNRRRALTLEMIQRLDQEWGLPASLLVKPYSIIAA
ncbi:MAG TPA: helix-turn-helix domain-containing protein [Devosia sp.]|jgi:HTH-type transcriptional regulator/antitoxin HigA|uniref:helix-turn-helix domain-containing protein n=1 Tax=Devosia sp. TaxID=1871048 RepID=UPI002F955A3F